MGCILGLLVKLRARRISPRWEAVGDRVEERAGVVAVGPALRLEPAEAHVDGVESVSRRSSDAVGLCTP